VKEKKYKYNKTGLKNQKGKLYKYNTKLILEEIKNHPVYIFENGKWKYINLTNIKDIHWLAKKAYQSWVGQGTRCNNPNPNNKSYQYYGAKGVKRIWSSRECVNFWINEFFKRKAWITPVVSRIEDKGNYELGNCELKENTENVSEQKVTYNRIIACRKNYLTSFAKKVKLTNINNPNDILKFISGREASRQLGKYEAFIKYSIKTNKIIIYKGKKYKPEYISKSLSEINRENN